MLDKFKESFKEEACELLNALEDCLLVLEEHPSDNDAIGAVFRTMHTIKGSAAMFGFTQISGFTHEIEDFMDDVRSGAIEVTPEMIDCTLAARDHIRVLLEKDNADDAVLETRSREILARFHTLKPIAPAMSRDELEEKGSCDDVDVLQTFRIRFQPHGDFMQNGSMPHRLVKELAGLGDISISTRFGALPPFSEVNPESAWLSWDIMLTTRKGKAALEDVFTFVVDHASLTIELVDTPDPEQEFDTPLGRILVERGAVAGEKVEQVASAQKKIGSLLVEQGVAPQEIRAALDEQEHIRKSHEKLAHEMSSGSIRVSSDKLDGLVDLVGELVTLQARLSETSREIDHSVLSGINETLERLIGELRDSTMGIRMLPIGNSFSKFKRLVRDLSKELGKEVELVTEGGETELDKTILEKLNDPLVHIIRNCLDHGLEPPSGRESAGKPRSGTIRLEARHSGASVSILIADDGRGIDLDRVRQKAIDRGLLSAQSNPGERDLISLILMPGFSTAQEISKVSGRGVGLDVVKKEIEALGGNLKIQTAKGQGTTMILEIPLTLAIIEGLMVEAGGERYIFPLSMVEECMELPPEASGLERISMEYRNNVLPVIHMRRILEIPGDPPGMSQVVVVNNQGRRVGLVVDTVIGDHQTVIKNLGKLYRDMKGVSGATILGDGSVALIIDVAGLISMSREVVVN